VPGLTQSRNDTDAHYFDSSATLQAAAANESRLTHAVDGTRRGYLAEGASTQLVPTASIRDCTDAAWTKSNVSAAKDAVGLTGDANSGSTLTADANDGTCFQAITLGSAERASSMYVKRKTGTGTVEFTDNGGTNYTDITASLSTSEWFLATNTRTQANPDFGFRLGTSADEIEVDAAQVEALPHPSSPILTETTRDADGLTSPSNLLMPAEFTVVVRGRTPIGTGGIRTVFTWSDGSSSDRFYIRRLAAGAMQVSVDSGSSAQAAINVLNPGNDTNFTIAARIKANDFGASRDGAAVLADTAGIMPVGADTIDIGQSAVDAEQWGSTIEFAKIFFYGAPVATKSQNVCNCVIEVNAEIRGVCSSHYRRV